jgi:RNA polymerase sigma factor (sigma-70 family)
LSNPSTRLEGLLEAEGVRLYSLLMRLTLHEEVADDLLQDLVVRLSQSKGFMKSDNPAAYARCAAINLAFDQRRRMKHRPKFESLVEEPETISTSPLRRLIDREQFDSLLAAMESLSELSRACLVLHYIEQLSYDDIAVQLCRTPHQVRAVCHKGVQRLKELMRISQNRPA